MSSIKITINGKKHSIQQPAAGTPLLYVLRNDLQLNGPKFGCGLAQCGACTVHVNGEAVRSCVTPFSAVQNAHITTLEGLGTPENPSPLQKAFIDEQAAQCGYCINGMIMQADALLRKTRNPSDQDIRESLAGNLCRCGTHLRIIRAIKRAAIAIADQKGAKV